MLPTAEQRSYVQIEEVNADLRRITERNIMGLSDQTPVGSGFHAKSTAAEVLEGIDLTGKTAIVTGGYSGIGLETVRGLASKGAKVIVPVRSEAKAQENLKDVAGDISTAAMDLADLASVRSLADSMRDSLDQLDLLINNAGIMACPEARVGPGWESQFGVCHMGHFALTKGLMPLLEKTPGARVVALSSTAHKVSDVLWDDVHYENTDYDKWQAYGQAKTANALFANALSRRLKASDGLAFSVHPGGIFTPLQRHLPKEEMIALGWLGEDGEPSELAKAGFKSPEQGASTTLWAATSGQLAGKPGVYCEDADVAAVTDPNSPMARYMGVNPHACDDEAAERLWSMSEDLLARA
jgi:NAD(P)-dependent dehydrogenase (short-subunit alcohol dehydrogenase family)